MSLWLGQLGNQTSLMTINLIDWFNLIDCLIFCYGASSLTDNCCTWYEAHLRNGLRISVLDEDLSPAQLAQLEEFLDFDVDEDLF